MNTLIDTSKSARYEAVYVIGEMTSRKVIRFPISVSPRLQAGIPEELSNIELSPFGLHWPQLDEDLSIRNIPTFQADES